LRGGKHLFREAEMDLLLTTLKDAISIVADLVGIIALLVSILKPEKKWARIFAVVGIFLIATTIVWNTLYLSSSKRTARAIEAKTYQELSHHTSQFLAWITQMIHRASDGFQLMRMTFSLGAALILFVGN
jgi:1,2-phenylacetyl-CoA epoxidase catalytic subunit